ncbi:DUF637 domain-containing protein [Pseudomonas seleniipraecipitans]|uniref:DUF637 domain-containing protein n=1 Tax=Phytopseudomonas seleniipraecipitans TaxID=640205 RepID=A0ABY5J6F9_9GAMM|nr:DUF637 domain-containing protein [Pseudomonas seleniipraecipitans]UUD62382.1 DUF637 domain-containing protein [Pseudomonas seleniipraecipitans]
MGLSRLPSGVVARSTASISLLAEGRIRNAQGGIIAGRDVSLQAGSDIINERSVATHQSANGKAYEHQRQMADSAARIEAEGELSMAAGRDLLNVGGALSAGGDAKLQAGQDLLIASQQTENSTSRYYDARNYNNRQQIDQYGSDVKVGGDLQAAAARDMAIVGSKVAAQGDMALQAGGSMTIASAANEYHYDAKRKGGGKKVEAVQDNVTQIASELSAGGDFRAVSGEDMNLSASRIDAGGSAYLYSGGQLNLLAAQNSDYSLYDKQSKGSFGAKATRRDEVTTIRHIGTEITTGSDLTLASAGDQLYQRARLDSGADLTLQSGGGITFEGVKDLDQESHEKSSNSLVWTSAKGKGTTDETLLQTQMIAQGEIAIKAVEGLNIDIKDVDQQTVTQTIDAMVEADPQLAWLKAAEQRGDVDWHRVKEIHDSFKYSHSGLGGGAAIVIAIIVAYFTAGAASGLVASAGSAAGATTAVGTGGALAAGTGASLAGAGWANLAATAVLTGAAGNAAVSTINNRGNLSAVYKDITSSDAVKGYAVAGVTAGLTAGLYDGWTGTETTNSSAGNAVGANTPLSNSGTVSVAGSGSGLSTLPGIGRFAANQALQNTTSAALSKLVGQDGSFSDALQSTLANTFMAAGFNWIGDNTAPGAKLELENGSLAKAGLHAVMGGLTAEAMGGDFKTGALAAGVNELLVEKLDAQYQKMGIEDRKAVLVMNSQLVGVFTAGLQGGDEQSLQVASAVAGGATAYNFLGHESRESRDKARKEVSENQNVEAASKLISLEKQDQRSDSLLDKYLNDKGSLTPSEQIELNHYVGLYFEEQSAKYGSETAQNLVDALLNEKDTIRDYSYSYAADEDVKSRQASFNREQSSGLGSIFWSRTKSENEEIYQDAVGLVKNHNVQQGQANIGSPALYMMSGPVGLGVRSAAAINGVGQFGFGIGQLADGQGWSGAGNIVFGSLDMLGASARSIAIGANAGKLGLAEKISLEKTERSFLGSSEGHMYAKSVTPGGTGTAFAGHGEYVYGAGNMTVPSGTAITIPREGIKILDETGRYIEAGDWVGLARAASMNPRIADDIQGMATWLPGSKVPNYILSAPNNPPLNILENSTTVESATHLDLLLKRDMGCVQWAACTFYKRR